MASGFTILHSDDFERSGAKYGLARRSLGLRSFGLNVVDLQPGERTPEHDEAGDDPQEEVFVVLDGSPTIVVDGEPHALRRGAFARLDPEPRRFLRNDGSEPATVLVASAPVTSGYRRPDWA